jgi:hypothetical protein
VGSHVVRENLLDLAETPFENLDGSVRRAERRIGLAKGGVEVGPKMGRWGVFVPRGCLELLDGA